MAIAALQLPCSSCCFARPGSAIPQKMRPHSFVCASLRPGLMQPLKEHYTDTATKMLVSSLGILPMLVMPEIASAEETSPGYSLASYYTSLGLFVLSLPGLWSLIKRSAKSKIVRKTYLVPGRNQENGKLPKQIAGEISSFFTRNNFRIAETGETVKFEGIMAPSRGQAAFLVFCTFLGLGSFALVLSITVPAVGDKWYLLTALSPLAGAYYWTRASRKEQIQVKLVVAEDGSSTDVIVQGDDEQINSLSRELGLMEKGMVYVKGILE